MPLKRQLGRHLSHEGDRARPPPRAESRPSCGLGRILEPSNTRAGILDRRMPLKRQLGRHLSHEGDIPGRIACRRAGAAPASASGGASMPQEQPRLGPWLRNAGRNEPRGGEGPRDYLVAGAAAAGGLLLLGVMLLAFLRFPFPTLAVLVAVWGVGYAVYRVKRHRADLQDQLRRMELERHLARPRDRETGG
jgi:hypothetical protein